MLFIFIYCLGPQNLWADTFSCLQVLSQNDIHAAVEKLKISFGVAENIHLQLKLSIDVYLIISLLRQTRRVFAIVFWFVVLGPIGARFISYCHVIASESLYKKHRPELIQSAFSINLFWIGFLCVFSLSFLHWAGILLTYFLLAKKAVLGLDINDKLLTECGCGSWEVRIAHCGRWFC